MTRPLPIDHPAQKRVLFLSGDMELGGAAMFVLNLCEGLRVTGGEWQGVAGVFSNLGEIGKQIRNRGLPVAGPFTGCLIHEEFIEAMHAECRRLKPAAVIANLGGEAIDFLRFVPESVLRVAIIHSDDANVYRQVEGYLPWIDLIVGVSARNQQVMAGRMKGRNIPVIQIACGVPMSNRIQAPQRAGGPLRVLYLGRVAEEQKRAGILFQVIRQTLDAGLDVEWTIAGDGPDLEKLRHLFSDDVARVKILGPVDYAGVPGLLVSQDVYFLCSDYEGLPLSMLEAMGAGLVPVVSDLPSGISEVVDETNGIRVPIHEVGGYVAALASLCNDRPRLVAMGVAASERVREDYSTEAMAGRWARALTEHAKPGTPDWSRPCVADAPPETRTRLGYHPCLRWLRRLVKSIRKQAIAHPHLNL